jgi:hypothetical protein
MKKEKKPNQCENVLQLVQVLRVCITNNNEKLKELQVILEGEITDKKSYEFTLHEYAFVEGCNTAYCNILESLEQWHKNEILTKTFNYN